ncbi:hypothetical protein SAMN05421504_11666 [Amycolatopsis xylanica]|uniref:NlpC/P60 family protein n=1 Tax=Amycolatopsis xylanica TaxID=589385 RepID=A0A1H3SYS8_9PSEU|nr:hypothetical protein [Amycolatopsis xylanica]SDZ42940.1 hypothetical protein SAMN05421504_11666 [Amycolatopsis xylanica]
MVTTAPDKSLLRLGRQTTRDEIIARAASWLRPSVPYSRDAFHENEHGAYRADCAGYISMAWGIPGGLDTAGLSKAGYEIAKAELAPGDALLRQDGTILFGAWANRRRTRFWGYEQVDGQGTVLHLVDYTHGRKALAYKPFRYIRTR